MSEMEGGAAVAMDEIPCEEIGDPGVLSKTPIVSVFMATYNHESYIGRAIEGVLLQETEFPIELVIGEDCSTDCTFEIVLEYQKQHPDLFRIISSDSNVGPRKNSMRVMNACRGKYIAFCEGDDYWTDSRKLQTQVDFLEANADCSSVIHAAEYVYEGSPEKNFLHRPRKTPRNNRFTTADVILDVAGNFATASLLLRSVYFNELPRFFYTAPVGDFPLMLILAAKGNIGFIDEPMCVYRVGTDGSWGSSRRNDREKRKKHDTGIIRVYNDFNSWTKNKYWFHVWLSKTKYSTERHLAELKSFIKGSISALGKK